MVGSRFIITVGFVLAFVCGTQIATANQSINPEHQSTPIDRGFGQHDACFGDKYETDDDLKTGNEISIEEVLKLLDSPGT